MSPGPQATSLGVDFGTSHTIAVVRRADGSVRPLLFDGAPLMPSAVCADAKGGLLVGRDAVHAGRRHPERFEPNPKRLIDRPSALLGEREFPVADLVAAVLGAVAEECRRVVGRPAQVTLTVPAEWGPARRRVVEEAAARSGLGPVRLVPEPVAAAAYYAEALRHRMDAGASIVVYDLGAGTFDASVVRRTGDGFATAALDGRGDLGGLDIDAALIEHLGATYGSREGWARLVDPSTVAERRALREFQEEVRGAKERLSRHQQADIAIPLLDVEAHLTRTELERIAEPHLEQTIRVTRAVMRAAGLDPADGAGVFLVGGASRMPLVATMLHRALGVAPTVLDQPEVVVAEGSVLWAGTGAAALPLQRPPQPHTPPAAGGRGGAPFTPQAPAAAPPHTEPAPRRLPPAPHAPTPQTAPALQDARSTAAAPPPGAPIRHDPGGRDPGRNLPPRAPQGPPGDDPPPTEAEARRARRVGRRAVVGFLLVDIVIIAGLVWYFGSDDSEGEDNDGGDPWITLEQGEAVPEAGTALSAILGAHDGPIASFAGVEDEAAGVAELFSAESDGTVHHWSMDTGELLDTYTVEGGVGSLHTTRDADGNPMVVAVGHDYTAWTWTSAAPEAFAAAGRPDLAEGNVVRVAAGSVDGAPVLGLLTEDPERPEEKRFELFGLADGVSHGVHDLPAGDGLANFYTGADGSYTNIVAVNPERRLDDVDGADGTVAGVFGGAYWEDGLEVEAVRVAYRYGSPLAMVFGADGVLRLWDLEGDGPYIDDERWSDLDAEYHHDVVDSADGPALLRIDPTGEAFVKAFDGGESLPLGDGDTGPVTELEDVLVDGHPVAVTGDENGNIQLWSLGL
ncbi:Hsp70 family protein [Glycomyces sp. A-F 0318]|uniref:Hsp70 family protein n=1 Tax=Glycomyces amatae TaxID=2881355 RepID=UPI001E61C846|nr:Hsp70 family protein [Glycomyces amatae]MCD0442181.1 Hsp70 family protein [Glycomyces amatae]